MKEMKDDGHVDLKILSDYANDMERNAASSRWDLYSQGPLTNGLAMLDALYEHMCLGVNLWNEDWVAGHVLHTYNLLRQKNVLKEPIPILEKLCTMLHVAVFLGHRPTRNFSSALMRFRGGKLSTVGVDFDPYSGAQAGRSHYIKSAKQPPGGGDANRRIKPEILSKVYAAHLDHFRLPEALAKCDKEAFGARWAKKTRSTEEKVWGPGAAYPSDKDYDEEDWTTHLEGRNTMRKINHEFRGEINMLDEDSFPLARVNSFAVYSLFRDILGRLWKEHKHIYENAQLLEHLDAGEVFRRMRLTQGGATIISIMMDQVDGAGKELLMMRGGRVKIGIMQSPREMMKDVAKAILQGTEGRALPEHYLWKHL